jgi:hypothetical protein
MICSTRADEKIKLIRMVGPSPQEQCVTFHF